LNELTKNIPYIKNQEIRREELIKVFEILYEKKLISNSELQHAILITNEKYKSENQTQTNSN
jgi:hypothetical protein